MCGGTGLELVMPNDWMGLSPRVRGNLEPLPPPPDKPGSIPACAGEPSSY